MKRRIVAVLAIGMMCIGLTGCTGNTYDNAGVVANDGYYINDYKGYESSSRTTLDGENVDYGYEFRATGATTYKKKDKLVAYFDELQDLVVENDGYVDSYSNDYDDYSLLNYFDYISSYEMQYKFYGTMNMQIEVPNENIDTVIDSLNEFCDKNGFTITEYSQSAVNYDRYRIIDEETYDEDSYYYDDSDRISQEEMERRVKYADLSVSLTYYQRRTGIEKQFIQTVVFFEEWREGLTTLINVIIITAIVLFIAGLIISTNISIHRKRQYKLRKKHPEYFQPKEVILHDKN